MKIVGTLPAGQYYVGDPCYAFSDTSDDTWKAFLASIDAAQGIDWQRPKLEDANKYDAVLFQHNGHTCFVSPTNTGDGCYKDQHGNEYGVDAGMIAALPVELAGVGNRSAGFAHFVTFPKAFKVGATTGRWRDGGKRIKVGHLTIRT